jgi:hypothetical protein
MTRMAVPRGSSSLIGESPVPENRVSDKSAVWRLRFGERRALWARVRDRRLPGSTARGANVTQVRCLFWIQMTSVLHGISKQSRNAVATSSRCSGFNWVDSSRTKCVRHSVVARRHRTGNAASPLRTRSIVPLRSHPVSLADQHTAAGVA